MADDLRQAVAGRKGWRMDGRAAVYTPPTDVGGWTVRVAEVLMATRRVDRWLATVIGSDGIARYARPTYSAERAVVP